ncbi:MAG: MerR family transcriptional regulator [Thermoanaerobaculia bacterium]|nr:MerR family transcriptional regulator [Thermoanaerobaculia bacterium]
MAKKTEKLYTLTELSKRSGVSLPTLQRYKKLYADRIPSEGSGRRQRYPEAAVAAVQELKKENLKKRGRRKATPAKKAAGSAKRAPRKRKSGSKRSPGGKKASGSGGDSGLLSLSEISRVTGISYPTLSKYVKQHLSRIPHEGTGRKRRYHPEAVDVFREIRASSRRGPAAKKPGRARAGARPASSAALASRVRSLERSQRELGKKLDQVLKQLKKPIQVSVRR